VVDAAARLVEFPAMSDNDPQRLILVGRVSGAFGVRGEIRIATLTEDPMALLAYCDLMREDGSVALSLTAARPNKGGVIARASQVSTPEAANALRGLRLYVPRAVLPPPDEEEFYHADLIGLSARTPEGETLGEVKAVLNFGAGDLLEIAPAGGGQTWYLPFTRAAVPEIDLAGGHLLVVRPEETE
jgi:16S rRNA processing protein RimM